MDNLHIILVCVNIFQFLIGLCITLYLIPKAKSINELFRALNDLVKEVNMLRESIHREYVGEQLFEKRVKSLSWDVVKEHCKDCPNHKALEKILDK